VKENNSPFFGGWRVKKETIHQVVDRLHLTLVACSRLQPYAISVCLTAQVFGLMQQRISAFSDKYFTVSFSCYFLQQMRNGFLFTCLTDHLF